MIEHDRIARREFLLGSLCDLCYFLWAATAATKTVTTTVTRYTVARV